MGIFEPFRAIGCIATGVPFSIQRLGTETFVTVSVGKSFQIFNVCNYYNTNPFFLSFHYLLINSYCSLLFIYSQLQNPVQCAKLTLVLVSPQLPNKITALASYRDYTFAAYGTNIAVFHRAHQVLFYFFLFSTIFIYLENFN
jgi:U3 small nucleolar RNA-associated protein 21